MGGGLGWGLMDGWWGDEETHNRWVARQSQLNQVKVTLSAVVCLLICTLHSSYHLLPEQSLMPQKKFNLLSCQGNEKHARMQS